MKVESRLGETIKGKLLVIDQATALPQKGVLLELVLGTQPGNLGADPEIDSPVLTTGDDGSVAFDGVRVSGPPRVAYLAARSLNGEATSSAVAVTIGPASATQIRVIQPVPATVDNGAPFQPAPRVQVLSGAKGLEGAAVIVARRGGDATITGEQAVTDKDGFASFPNLRVVGECHGQSCGRQALVFLSGQQETAPTMLTIRMPALATLTLEEGADREVSSGAPINGLRIKATSASGLPLPGVRIHARDASGHDLGTHTSAPNGVADIPPLRVVARAGESSVVFSSGGVQVVHRLTIKPGEPHVVSVTNQPGFRIAYDSVLAAPPIVEVTDAAGNPLSGVQVRATLCARPAVNTRQQRDAARKRAEQRELNLRAGKSGDPEIEWLCDDLSHFNASLHGTTQVPTGADGRAEFTNLRIRGRTADYRIRFLVNGVGVVHEAVTMPLSHLPLRDYDQNMVGISAIKTISGKAPDNEFFDLRFRFRLGYWAHLLANTDVALSSRDNKDSLSSPQRRLTEAALMLNGNALFVRSAYSDVPQRLISAGAQLKIFSTIPYWGVHVAGTELGGSPFQGSSLTVSYLNRWYRDTTAVIDGDTLRVARNNLGVDFFVRSSIIEFFKVLTIRGTVLVPFGNKARPATRIAVAVPLGDVYRF